MKNKFTKNDIGKSFKVDIFDKGIASFFKGTFKGVYIGEYRCTDKGLFKGIFLFGYFENQTPKFIDLTVQKLRNITPTRLQKEVGLYGRKYVSNNKHLLPFYVDRNRKLNDLLKLNHHQLESEYKNIETIILNNKDLDKLKILNKVIDYYFPDLYFLSNTEDYCEQDLKEYGITEIEDTRHLQLIFLNTVVMEYFKIDNFNFKSKGYVEVVRTIDYNGITVEHLYIIENIIAIAYEKIQNIC